MLRKNVVAQFPSNVYNHEQSGACKSETGIQQCI